MRYGTRLVLALREIALAGRISGPKVALHEVRSRFCRTSESLFFARQPPFPPPALPEGIHIDAIPPDAARGRRDEVVAAGAGITVLNFDRRAVCYLAYVEGEPAGAGWWFPESRLLHCMGLDGRGAYLGGFLVRPDFRGRGLYPLLLQTICHRAIRAEHSAFSETGLQNHASRRGLEKAGFVLQGRLRQTALAGLLVSCRLKKLGSEPSVR